MTNVDLLILLALNSSDMLQVLSPGIISYNLGFSRGHTSRRLSELAEQNYVEKVDDGKYRLTTTGKRHLEGQGESF